jgi:hypothetical protein
MAFEKGNKTAQEWTLENAKPRFDDALEFAENDQTCLCLQDAIYFSGIPYTTFYYLSNNEDVLNAIKQNIMNAVTRRINRLALKDQAPAAPAIWRMKQLGEKDEQTVKTEGTLKQEIVVSTPETKQALEDLKNKFENE